VTAHADPAFGDLLRDFRDRAGLTQEALAESAGLSVDAIGLLERGARRHPQRQTVRQLAAALDLSEQERTRFAASAQRIARPIAGGTSDAMPIPATSFIGRTAELAAIVHAFTRDRARLITLTGPGGVGKTRLGLAVAAQLAAHFADGIIFVPLSTLPEPSMLAPALARAIGLVERAGEAPLAGIRARLGGQRLLLVFDNVEHLLVAGAAIPDVVADVVADILATCPQIGVLATSRIPLRLSGERQFPVLPLAVPADDRQRDWAELAQLPAVALFAERARAVSPSFALTPANTGTIVAICRQLDGLPLAIELAAAWVKVLPPPALLARLERRLDVLIGGARDLPTRQQSLRNTITWSDDLLLPAERTLLRRLSVFVGGATLEAIEAICAADGEGAAAILLNVSALVDASLLWSPPRAAAHEQTEAARFLLLELVREYAAEHLAAHDDAEGLHRRHATYYLALVEQAQEHLVGPDEAIWLARLAAEHPNLRAALRWALDRDEMALAVRFAAVLWRFWAAQAHYSEGRRWLEEILAAAGRATGSRQGEEGTTTVFPAQYAMLLHVTGNLARAQGDYPRARAVYEECLALRRGLDDRNGMGGALHNLGIVAHEQGDLTRAAQCHEAALGLFRATDDAYGVAFVLASLGDTVRAAGDLPRALILYAESLDRFRQLGHSWGIAQALASLGDATRQGGDARQATRLYREMLLHSTQIGDRRALADGLERLAQAAAMDSQEVLAATLCGAAAALRDSSDIPPRSPLHQGDHERLLTTIQEHLGAAAFTVAWEDGATQPLDRLLITLTRQDP